MTKSIIANFSNGLADEYKGTREVKAAWVIFNKETGETLNSGHSLTTNAAASTAATNMGHLMPSLPKKPTKAHLVSEHEEFLKWGGWATHKEMAAERTAERAVFRAAHTIEIVEL